MKADLQYKILGWIQAVILGTFIGITVVVIAESILIPATLVNQIIDVTWYGARGDGSDSTVAISNAFRVSKRTGVPVFFPVGQYGSTGALYREIRSDGETVYGATPRGRKGTNQ